VPGRGRTAGRRLRDSRIRVRPRSPPSWPASTASPTGQSGLREARPEREAPARWSGTGPRRTRRGTRRVRLSSRSSSSVPRLSAGRRPALDWRAVEKISMPTSFRLTCRPTARQASYPLTKVASGFREEISRTFGQLWPGSRAAARRHVTQSSAVRTCSVASCTRTRNAARRCSRSCARLPRSSLVTRVRRAITGLHGVHCPALPPAVVRGRKRRTASEAGRSRRCSLAAQLVS
jgi:hypothetical protein